MKSGADDSCIATTGPGRGGDRRVGWRRRLNHAGRSACRKGGASPLSATPGTACFLLPSLRRVAGDRNAPAAADDDPRLFECTYPARCLSMSELRSSRTPGIWVRGLSGGAPLRGAFVRGGTRVQLSVSGEPSSQRGDFVRRFGEASEKGKKHFFFALCGETDR
jgi:hypothetical protein